MPKRNKFNNPEEKQQYLKYYNREYYYYRRKRGLPLKILDKETLFKAINHKQQFKDFQELYL